MTATAQKTARERRSATGSRDEPPKAEVYAGARTIDVTGRFTMTNSRLEAALT